MPRVSVQPNTPDCMCISTTGKWSQWKLIEKITDWKAGDDENGHHGEWLCLICDHGSGTWKKGKNIRRHEESTKHNKAVQRYEISRSGSDGHTTLQRIEETRLQPILTAGEPNLSTVPLNTLPPQDFFTITGSGIDLGLDNDNYNVGTPEHNEINYYDMSSFVSVLDTGHMAKGSKDGELAIVLNNWFASGPVIGDDSSSDSENEELENIVNIYDPGKAYYRNNVSQILSLHLWWLDLSLLQNVRPKEFGLYNKDGDWFPWASKSVSHGRWIYRGFESYWSQLKECVMDMLCHLPRSIFSDKEMASISWAMNVLGASNVPSESRTKAMMKGLQIACGIETIRYQGALGHIFYLCL